MLTDPLVVKSPTLSAASAITVQDTNSYARVDAGDGSARYVCAIPLTEGETTGRSELKISHSVSQENKPAKTDRTLVRLDFNVVDTEGREMLAYAYAVIGIPRGNLKIVGTEISPLTGVPLVQMLIGALGASSTAATLDASRITRILAGES